MAGLYTFANQPAGQVIPLGWLDYNFAYIENQLGNEAAGSTGQIQFNNNGNLGASPNLVFNNATGSLGIGTSNAPSPLTVSAASGIGSGLLALCARDYSTITFNSGTDLPSDQVARIVTANSASLPGGRQLTLITTTPDAPVLLSPNDRPALIAYPDGNVEIPYGKIIVGSPTTVTGAIQLCSSSTDKKVSVVSALNASDWTLTLPTGPGTAGQVLKTDGAGNTSWTNSSSGAAAGANTQIQFNKNGALGANANFVFDDTNVKMGLGVTTPLANIHISAPANTSAGQIAICSPEYSFLTFNSGDNLPTDQTARIVAVNDASLPGGKQLALITENDHPIVISPNDSQMLITTSIGVGIGNLVGPATALQISKPNVSGIGQVAICSPDYSAITLNSGNNLPADQIARIVTANDPSLPGGQQLTFITDGAYPILLSPNNAPALTVSPTGNVSIGGSSSSGASLYIQNSTGFGNPQIDLRAPDYCHLSFSKGSSFPSDQMARIVTANDSSLPGGIQLSILTNGAIPIYLSPNDNPALTAQPNGDVWVSRGNFLVGTASNLAGNIRLYNATNTNTVSVTSGVNTASWTLKLPTGPGANGQYLQTDGAGNTSWAAGGGGGGGSPAGSNSQVQFNNAGSFGANSNFVFDNINTRLGIGLSNPAVALQVANSTGFNNPQIVLSAPDFCNISFNKGTNYPSDEIARIVTSNTTGSGGYQLNLLTSIATAPVLLTPNNVPTLIAYPTGNVEIPNGNLIIGKPSTIVGAIKLYNATNANVVTLASGTTTTSWTMKLPATAGTNGQYLQTDGAGNTTWAAGGGGGGGSPAGSDTQVQYNDAGSFGANANFVFNATNTRLGIGMTSPSAALHVANSTGFNNPQVALSAPDYCNFSFNKGTNLPSDQIARIVTANTSAQPGGIQLSLITNVSAPIILSPNGLPSLQAEPTGDVWVPNGNLLVGKPSLLTGAIKLYSSSNANTVTVASAANSSNWTMTLPSNPGTAGQVLSTNGSGTTTWVNGGGGGGGSPAGSNSQIQFNSVGSFGANSNFVFDNANVRLGVGITNPTAPVTVQAPYTGNTGQIDVLNTGSYQMITLRDPSNPNADKRNISLVGYYDANGPHGNIVCAGDFYINANGASSQAGFGINLSGEAIFPLGKITVGLGSTTSGTIKLYNSSNSNAVTLASGVNSSNWTFKFPTSAGTNGQFLQTDGAGNTSWAAAGGGGSTTPAGSNTQVQFNNAGAFGASSNFVFNSATSRLSVGTSLTPSPLTINATTGAGNGILALCAPDYSTITFNSGTTLPTNQIARIVTANTSAQPGGQQLTAITTGPYPIVLSPNNSPVLSVLSSGEVQIISGGGASSGYLYVSAGALYFRGGSGTVTKIANA